MAVEQQNKEWNGENYHHHSQIQYRLAKDLLQRCTFRGNENVLDIGCGDGKITKEIAVQIPNGRVLGVDNSASMISFANLTYPSETNQNLRFELKDAVELPYVAEFDLVFSFCCLHWIKDQKTALQNIYRSLKPEGQFIAVIPYALNLDRAINATIAKEEWKGFFEEYVHPTRNYELEEYEQLLRSANFPPHSVELRQTIMFFEGRMEFFRWLKQLLPHLRYIPSESHELFIDQIIETVLIQLPNVQQQSGALHIPLPVLEVQARKEDHSACTG